MKKHTTAADLPTTEQIARERGVKMPSFFGYMLWSIGILIPTFLLCTWLFFL